MKSQGCFIGHEELKVMLMTDILCIVSFRLKWIIEQYHLTSHIIYVSDVSEIMNIF